MRPMVTAESPTLPFTQSALPYGFSDTYVARACAHAPASTRASTAAAAAGEAGTRAATAIALAS